MRKIKLEELRQALRKLQSIVPYDVFSWLILWKAHRLDQVDFDHLETVVSKSSLSTQGMIAIAQILKLTIQVVEKDGPNYVLHEFERGLHVYAEIKQKRKMRWEKKEYDQYGNLIRRELSSGVIHEFKYDTNGRIIDVDCDPNTKDKVKSNTQARLMRDGKILKVMF